jgi:hypothetical protein
MLYSRRGLGADRDGVSSDVLVMMVGRSGSSENGGNDEGSRNEQSRCLNHDDKVDLKGQKR